MELKDAIGLVRNWRISQELDALPPDLERAAASKLLIQKGWNLPDKINDFDGSLYLIDGVYVKPMETKDSIEITIDNPPQPTVLKPDPFPWNPGDKREFWCDPLKNFVRFTGDLNADGNYYVTIIGDGTLRRYPVKGKDLVLKEKAPADVPYVDLLLINRTTWGEIKNFMCERFIPSYPWTRYGDRSPADIRADMELLAKSKNKGLAKLIEDERKSHRGSYENAENFSQRLTALHESFPWGEFAQMLDFCQ